MPNPLTGLTQLKSTDITDGSITNAKISPSPSIPGTKVNVDLGIAEAQTPFNIGLLGFKHAVNEGLTVFNLMDGVVDEFNSEDGIDTSENSNITYDSTSDFYTNSAEASYPGSPYVVSDFTSPGTYTAPSTTTAVNLLVVGAGGGGGGSTSAYAAGGGGAGGLIYLNNLPVTSGGTYSITIGEGGEGGSAAASSASIGEDGGDTTFAYSPSVNIIGEGGGGAGYVSGNQRPGGSGGGLSNQPPVGTTGGSGTQASNHPVTGLSDFEGTAYPNSPPSYSAENSEQVGSFGNSAAGPQVYGFGGGGAGSTNFNHPNGAGQSIKSMGGEGLDYNILDGSTAVGFGGGGGAGRGPHSNSPGGEGGEGDEGGRSGGEGNNEYVNPDTSQMNGVANTGGGGGGSASSQPVTGGDGADGRVVVATTRFLNAQASTTLISDTFTALATPSEARLVIFAEIEDDLNTDINASVTRDNTTFNAVTLTDEGYQTGSSGVKIFSGSTPLTGSASPQVQLRWKIVGSNQVNTNKIHGVALQWA
tara:strand:+ start:1951 stop:3540 length:1590 start_codon:yes stop_codon:yes gene_type:complete